MSYILFLFLCIVLILISLLVQKYKTNQVLESMYKEREIANFLKAIVRLECISFIIEQDYNLRNKRYLNKIHSHLDFILSDIKLNLNKIEIKSLYELTLNEFFGYMREPEKTLISEFSDEIRKTHDILFLQNNSIDGGIVKLLSFLPLEFYIYILCFDILFLEKVKNRSNLHVDDTESMSANKIIL